MPVFAERIAHVDMDAFFVEVERLRNPDLVGLPVVVGGTGNRGVVASASYEARRFGIRSAMPAVHARRLCPDAAFLPSDHTAYREASRAVFEVLDGFSPLVEALSVDEAFIDIGGLGPVDPGPEAAAHRLRREIRESTGLPASVGIATNKLLAKLASEDAKPDGVLLVPAGNELAYLQPKEVRALWGVGEATHARLEELGARTIGDLAALPLETLEARVGRALGGHLWRLARADDDRPVEPGGEAKSISVEQTYERDLVGAAAIEREVLRHADRLARRLRRAGYAARTITLKVRFHDFTTITRSYTSQTPIDSLHGLIDAGRQLMERADIGRRSVRLLGLGGGMLESSATPRQLDLDGGPWDEVETAMDRIRDRFGEEAVGPARLVPPPENPNPEHGAE
jgi:DNA polymerase-4